MSAERVILICPDQRPGLEALAAETPLALQVFLGKPLLDHALDGLARRGVKEVLLLVSGRPAEVREFVTDGHPWGLKLKVVTETVEPTPEAARERHRDFQPEEVLTLDALPQAPDCPVLESPATWHGARRALLPLLAPRMVGAREIRPGVWLGLRARVDPSAELAAPCWIGPGTIVNRGAAVRGGFVEEGSVIDHDAVVEDGTVGPRTCLGGMTHLRESIAQGSLLLNWRNGSVTRLTDAFLLSPLAEPRASASPPPARAAALLALVLTSPVLPIAALRSSLSGKPLFHHEVCVAPPETPGRPRPRISYREFAAFTGPWRRWPRLWNIVRGEFAWTGNPPLTPCEADRLEGEFERLWLAAPPGVFTAPETEGCVPPWDDEARAHAALFASRPDAAWRRRILLRGLRSLWGGASARRSVSSPAHP